MGGLRELEEQDYVLLKHLKVEFRRDDDDDDDGAEEANGCFTLCFWIYIDNCASFPSEILVQVSQLLPSLNPPLLFFFFVRAFTFFDWVFRFFVLPEMFKDAVGLVAKLRKP